VTLTSLAVGNLMRNKFRTGMTVAAVAVAITAFVLLRTVISAWNVGVEFAARDRIGTRHRVSFVMQLPRRYVDTVRQTRGVRAATWANWFGGKDPRDPSNFFASMAVDPESFLDVYDEISVPADVRARWQADRRGVLIGDVLARRLHARVGDRVTLQGTIYPGDWQFNIVGIYTATRRSMDRSQFLFHWNYLNESLPPTRRDTVGWIVSRIDDPSRSGSIAHEIDRAFEQQDVQTLSMSERAMNASFMGMFAAVLKAINAISLIVLLILLMVIGNTVSMGVRERTNEYGVLRALGFLPRHLVMFILVEAIALGALSGLVGLAVAFPFVQLVVGRALEENMGAWFPYFRIDKPTIVAAFVASVLLGIVAAAVPAFRAARLTVTDALRRLD